MTDRLQLAALWDAPPCAGEGCSCARCAAALDDPAAAEVFAALDATRRDLASLSSAVRGSRTTGPGPGSPEPGGSSLPEDLRAHILATVRAAAGSALSADEPVPPPARTRVRPTGRRPGARRAAARPAGPPDARDPRGSRRPGRRPRVALLAALGIAVVAGIVGWPAGGPPDAPPAAEGPPRHALVGTPGPGRGPLADPERQAACLAAVGIPPATALATRDVAVDGVPGVLLVLPTGTTGTYRLLVVDAGCSRVLADRTAGR